jgi:hypothetical protein
VEQLRPHQEHIPKYVTSLLINCPNESAPIRKELLIATRHILATDFRSGFISQIETLLDEKVLVGTGRTSHETLRPLAYSTLADLVHHVRSELGLGSLARVVSLYTRTIHDTTLPFAIQTMSAKLLLNLVECIARKYQTEPEARSLLLKILDAFVNKFSSLKNHIPKLAAAPAAAASGTAAPAGGNKDSAHPPAGPHPHGAAAPAQPHGPGPHGAAALPLPGSASSIMEKERDRDRTDSRGGADRSGASAGGDEYEAAPNAGEMVRDCRLLLKTLVLGLKNIVWGISSCGSGGYTRVGQTATAVVSAGACSSCVSFPSC